MPSITNLIGVAERVQSREESSTPEAVRRKELAVQPPVVWPGQPSAGGLGFEGFGVKGESFVVETWVGAKESGFEMFEHDTGFSK